ncbi:MAG: zinc dependent phospholipase C family protein [Lachnospiraceae bacterium]|nr:zinc dependent phospholipase C family protein [Lachnospiraceae bacterium]MDY4970098.1 zinc dependent phospholipase C family protein [Lachnospiraceae bacterium]
MRKKSHIGLARFLTADKSRELLASHRYFFYAGSILPDCRPSFITTRHNIESTLPLIQEYMERVRLHQIRTVNTYLNRRDCITLGQIFHYIADYFTYPHNSIYPGSLKDHCSYEQYLKLRLKEYFVSGEALRVQYTPLESRMSTKDIIRFIEQKHQEYLALPSHDIESDCRYIIAINQSVLSALSA